MCSGVSCFSWCSSPMLSTMRGLNWICTILPTDSEHSSTSLSWFQRCNNTQTQEPGQREINNTRKQLCLDQHVLVQQQLHSDSTLWHISEFFQEAKSLRMHCVWMPRSSRITRAILPLTIIYQKMKCMMWSSLPWGLVGRYRAMNHTRGTHC